MRAEKSTTLLLALGALAAVITALVYLPSLSNGFVEWDDQVYVYENKELALEGLAFLKWAATAVVSSNWHPLTLLTYGVEYSLWGLDPFGYHLVNVIFHSLNTFLVFALGTMFFRKALGGDGAGRKGALAAAFLAALVFGIHPQRVESVAWVSERKDVLSGFFFLLSLIFYVRHTEDDERRRWYWASFASFALALLSKPMAITLPVVLLILDFCPLGRLGGIKGLKALFIEKLPFFALIPAAAALTIWAQHGDEAMASIEASPLSERFDVALRGFVFYLEKLFYPADLAPFYVRPLAGEFYNHIFLVSLLAVVLITALALVFLRRRALAAAWAYYLVTLLPVIGLVQVSDMAAADRYSYLPVLGPVFFISGALGSFAARGRRAFAAVAALSLPLLVISGALTVKQQAVWKDTVSLWTQEIKVFPTVQAYMKRARAYEAQKRFNDAAADYTVVVNNTGEGRSGVYLRRGFALRNAGDSRAALSDFSESIRLNPGNAAAYILRGELLMNSGDLQAALDDLEKALGLSPEDPRALYYLALACERAGETGRARSYMERAAALGLVEASGRLRGR